MSANSSATQEPFYPRLLRRVQAALIDSVVVTIAFFTGLVLVAQFGFTSLIVNILVWSLPVLLLEPGLVAWTGGSIGHHLRGIRIRKLDRDKNLNIFQAIYRFLLKSLLGWLSLIFVLTTKKHQAIHDIWSRSLVVIKRPNLYPDYELKIERIVEKEGYKYPGSWRRVSTIIGYIVLMTIAYSIYSSILDQIDCRHITGCETTIGVFLYWSGYAWLFLVGVIAVSGWHGRLPGCRRKPIKRETL